MEAQGVPRRRGVRKRSDKSSVQGLPERAENTERMLEGSMEKRGDSEREEEQ